MKCEGMHRLAHLDAQRDRQRDRQRDGPSHGLSHRPDGGSNGVPSGGSGDERGSATMLTLTAITVLLFVTGALAGVGGLIVALRSAQATADLAALAAAQTDQAGGDACAAAAAVATGNDARLESCSVVDDDAWVEVSVAGPRLLGERVEVAAQARAGPVASAG